MFRRKVKEDPTELQLLKIRVQNLEKQVAEPKKAPQVQAEELVPNHPVAVFITKNRQIRVFPHQIVIQTAQEILVEERLD